MKKMLATAAVAAITTFYATAVLAQPSTVALAAAVGDAHNPQMTLQVFLSEDVANDQMSVTLFIEKEARVASTVNSELFAELNALIAEAKKVPGVEAVLGSTHTGQYWTQQDQEARWRVRGEVVLTSASTPELGALVGRLVTRPGVMIGHTGFDLSADKKSEVVDRLITRAGAELRRKAGIAVKSLGFESFEITLVNISDNIGQPGPVMPLMMRATAERAASPDMPTEGVRRNINVTMGASIALKK